MLKKHFHIIIDNEEELLLQRNYYADMKTRQDEKLAALQKEISTLQTANEHYANMIKRIDQHLAPSEETANTILPFRINPSLFDEVEAVAENKKTDVIIQVKKEAEPELLAEPPVKIQRSKKPEPEEDTYAVSTTKALKAEYALKKIGSPASTRDILTLLIVRDPELITNSQTTFDKYQKAMAATLIQKAAAKSIFYSIREENTVKYGLIEWEAK